MKSKELCLTFSHEQEKGLKEFKAGTREGRIPTIQLQDTPYQGIFMQQSQLNFSFLSHILYSLLALWTSSNSQPAEPSPNNSEHSWSRGIWALLTWRDPCLIQDSTRPPAALGEAVPGESWCLEHPPAAPGPVSQQSSPYPAVGSPAGAGRACGSSRAGCTAPAAAPGMECCQELATSKKKPGKFNPSSSHSWWTWEGTVYELRELRSKWIRDPWRAHRAKLHLSRCQES